MYTVREVSQIPISEVIRYVREHYPPNVHFYANAAQLRYLALTFLDQEGYLDPRESQILREPYFGQLYAASGGSTLSTVEHFFINFIPGLDYL